MKTVVLVAVLVLVGLFQAGWAEELPPGVIVKGQVYIDIPGHPLGPHWEPLGFGWSVAADPGDFLFATRVTTGPGDYYAQFGINPEGTPVVGAYEGLELISLGSLAMRAFDFDVYASTPGSWGDHSLALQFWGLPEFADAVLAWSSVGPWSSEPVHVHLDTLAWAGYRFQIVVVPEPAGACCMFLGVGILLGALRRAR